MPRILTGLLALLVALAAPRVVAISLDQAMADPDWLGPSVEQPYWALDSRTAHYQLKRDGSPVRDLYRIDSAGGTPERIEDSQLHGVDAANPVFDATRSRAAFLRNGDVFLRDLASGTLLQVTRTTEAESDLSFSADARFLHYRRGMDWYRHDIAQRLEAPAVLLKAGKDPADAKPDDLAALQLEWYATLRAEKAEREAQRERELELGNSDTSRPVTPIFLGEDANIVGTSLSPGGRWLIAVTQPKDYAEGKRGKLQRYVTQSGYEEQEQERTYVGRNDPPPHTLWLVDAQQRTVRKIDLGALPGLHDDPLAAVREENRELLAEIAKQTGADAPAKAGDKRAGKKAKADNDKPRALRVGWNPVSWTRDGAQAAVQLRAIDNKDRWIATVDFDKASLVPQHRLTDDAWINWNFNEFGWLDDNRTLWFMSEETGYGHLYTQQPGGRHKALTRGDFEIQSPALSGDGQWFYVRSNAQAPYSYDIYRVASSGGALERITRDGGIGDFTLSPDGRQLLALRSEPYLTPQLAVVPADGSGALRQLTDTRSEQFRQMQWPKLEIVGVPSQHGAGTIWSKLYRPADFDPARKYPAVLFVHGAGYLQNTHLQWPNYFREQFFHNLLTEQGYVVLDMDFRASSGYGRDWRTAIYRQMGHPELEDLLDGKAWLVENHNVDADRVGLYGGSYGGFMSLMALFRAPGEFAAGAALRPVTDWTQYNHGYTSNILNTPQVDPLAYRRSSPMEYADGLQDGLLIAHGVIDDNVLFADSMRLFQRLVELRKENFELAPYPMERHGFKHADSWYDEYRRIFELFEKHMQPER